MTYKKNKQRQSRDMTEAEATTEATTTTKAKPPDGETQVVEA
jgi:hypothetical protein